MIKVFLWGLYVIAAFLFLQEGIFINVVTREEKKFLINIDEFRSKSHYFDMLMIQDEHNGTDGYIIRSLRMTKADSEALIAGKYDVLLKYEDDFAAECYGLMHYKCYRPKTIVQYNRKAYIAKENKIRITFDNNIIATESNFDLFSENLIMHPVLDKFNVVLEVKFNGFLLDYIRQFINSINKSELSVSKYALARQQSYAEI